jgi:type VI protein secretion system component VasF
VLTVRVSETPSTAVEVLSGPVSQQSARVPSWLVGTGVVALLVVLWLLLSR